MSMNSFALDSLAAVSPPPGAATAPQGPVDESGITQPGPSGKDTTNTNIAGWGDAEINDYTLMAYLVGWGLFLLLLALFNRTRWGHAIIYYMLVLVLLVLVLGNYQAFGHLLAPVSGQLHGPPEEPGGGLPEGPNPPEDQLHNPGGIERSTTSPIRAAAPRFNISGVD